MSRPLPFLGPDERRLICNCARLELTGVLRHRTEELLQKPLDWSAILLFAEAHSVAPLLHHHVQRIDRSALIPPEVQRELLRLTHRTAFRNQQYATALREVLDLFAEGGVPVMVLKGLSLVELVYKDLSLRPLIDINLLIPRERLEAARALLSRAGYMEAEWTRSPFYRSLHSQILLTGGEKFQVWILLQWGVVNRPLMHALDLRRFWHEARPARVVGRDTLIPSPIDFILYLCIQPDRYGYLNASALHAEAPHRLIFDEATDNRLIRFTDVYESIKHYQGDLDWERLIERARATAIEGSVYTSLHWTATLLGPVAEARVVASLRPPPARRIRRWLFAAIAEQPTSPAAAAAARALFRRWWLRRPTRLRRRFIGLLDFLEFVFPRRSELRLHYRLRSEQAVLAAYPVHAVRWIARLIRDLPQRSIHLLRSRLPAGEPSPSRG